MKNFVKNYANTSVTIPSNLELFSIGFLGVDFSKFDLYYYHGLDPIHGTDVNRRHISGINRLKMFTDCLNYAKLNPCDSCSEHGPLCTSQ